jgi:predicted N-formylglutamate amidohydrolase
VPLSSFEAFRTKFESKLVLDLLEVILGAEVNNVVKDHAKLPTRLGGLGLSSAVMEADAAYLSSWNDVIRQVFDGAVPTYLVARFSDLRANFTTFVWIQH